MHRLIAVAALGVALLVPASAAHAGQVKAGAAAVDASWHVGASAGQYASDGSFVGVHGADPHVHSTKRTSSYGIQSRLETRAIVIESAGGERVAVVKNDLYIPQDLLWRRTAQLLEKGDSGIGRENLTMAVTHNHSSPYYSSTSWGAWAFQDVFDIRFYNYYAERMAEAVEKAAAQMVPVRVGASVSQFDKTHRHSYGPAIADDGTPAGYPIGETDHDMVVIRFDDVSNPKRPKPLANLVNFSLHPEFLEGNDLISADYIGPLERMVDRGTKALTIWTQNAVGTSEPERSSFHSVHERLEFTHRDYAQAEFGARLMADSVIDTWRDVAAGTPEDANRFVPFDSDFDVGVEDRWFPGPLSHPYPGVSNCRTDTTVGGDPQVPIAGLPDCQGPSTLFEEAGLEYPIKPSNLPFDPGVSTDTLQQHGIPVPENYSAPAYTGLEEDVSVHLQAIRLGDVLLTVCSCEQWYDQSANIETRTDKAQDNMHLGYDWSKRCTDQGDGTWLCPNPGNPSQNLPPISDHELKRMRAQVNNDADGWNSLDYLPYAESEPTNPEEIKGNYTHRELSPELGYKLTVPISMANDYNGYIATYREYQRGDHYRKALTAWGPHSSDYMASRLVALGGVLNGGDEGELMPEDHGSEKVEADNALNDRRAELLGEIGTNGVKAYEATLPDDAGGVVAVSQPEDSERFGAALFTWTGGSNYTDNPTVRVQRQVSGRWVDFADQSGEIPVTLEFAQPGQPWEWTAHFEAFSSPFDTGSGRTTPAGTYRFLVRGQRRQGGAPEPYEIASDAFEVKPWSGVTVDDLRVEPDGTVSFAVGPRHTVDAEDMNDDEITEKVTLGPIDYPDSYESPARFIRHKRWFRRDPAAPSDASKYELYCFTCSFRPWQDTGDAQTARVTIVDGKRRRTVTAVRQGDRWQTTTALSPGQSAFVAAGAVRDEFGNFNGADSGSVTR